MSRSSSRKCDRYLGTGGQCRTPLLVKLLGSRDRALDARKAVKPTENSSKPAVNSTGSRTTGRAHRLGDPWQLDRARKIDGTAAEIELHPRPRRRCRGIAVDAHHIYLGQQRTGHYRTPKPRRQGSGTEFIKGADFPTAIAVDAQTSTWTNDTPTASAAPTSKAAKPNRTSSRARITPRAWRWTKATSTGTTPSAIPSRAPTSRRRKGRRGSITGANDPSSVVVNAAAGGQAPTGAAGPPAPPGRRRTGPTGRTGFRRAKV